jgi:hypothetical protein
MTNAWHFLQLRALQEGASLAPVPCVHDIVLNRQQFPWTPISVLFPSSAAVTGRNQELFASFLSLSSLGRFRFRSVEAGLVSREVLQEILNHRLLRARTNRLRFAPERSPHEDISSVLIATVAGLRKSGLHDISFTSRVELIASGCGLGVGPWG